MSRANVTAGFRNAEWTLDALPDGTAAGVFPLRTVDGAATNGFLYRRGQPKAVVCIMHPREFLATHYMIPALIEAGYGVFTQTPLAGDHAAREPRRDARRIGTFQRQRPLRQRAADADRIGQTRGADVVGYDVPVITSNSNMTYAQMTAYKDAVPKDFYFTSARGLLPENTLAGPLRDAQTVYVNAFRKLRIRPDIGHSLIWDPAMVFIDALRHVGPAATAEQLRDYVLSEHPWVGINGVYDFASGDQRGLGDGSIVVARWDPAKSTRIQVSAPKAPFRFRCEH